MVESETRQQRVFFLEHSPPVPSIMRSLVKNAGGELMKNDEPVLMKSEDH